jgi:hypothetical protein
VDVNFDGNKSMRFQYVVTDLIESDEPVIKKNSAQIDTYLA